MNDQPPESDQSTVSYRLAVEADIPATFEVFVLATNDLSRRIGRPQTAGAGVADRAMAFRRHAIRHDGERFWVAEADGHVIGFAVGILRGDVWYLAALHVRPEFQARHVGSTLIRRSLAGTSSSTVLTVYTDAVNAGSNGLYMAFGMLAQEAIPHYAGPIGAGPIDAAGTLQARPITLPEDARALEDIDRTTLGYARVVDHELWSNAHGVHGILLLREGIARGYAYVSGSGHIGPVAVHQPADIAAALDIAAGLARDEGATELHIRAAGSCREAARWSLALGLRLSGIGLMLSSSPVGRMDRYLASSSDALF